jgi:hypothetical protein
MAGAGGRAAPNRRPQSKSFHRIWETYQRQAFTGPPENVRDHVMAASRSLAQGEWARSFEFLRGLNAWALLPRKEAVLGMLRGKVQEEAVRTYLLTYAQQYASLSLDTLAASFQLPDKQASGGGHGRGEQALAGGIAIVCASALGLDTLLPPRPTDLQHRQQDDDRRGAARLVGPAQPHHRDARRGGVALAVGRCRVGGEGARRRTPARQRTSSEGPLHRGYREPAFHRRVLRCAPQAAVLVDLNERALAYRTGGLRDADDDGAGGGGGGPSGRRRERGNWDGEEGDRGGRTRGGGRGGGPGRGMGGQGRDFGGPRGPGGLGGGPRGGSYGVAARTGGMGGMGGAGGGRSFASSVRREGGGGGGWGAGGDRGRGFGPSRGPAGGSSGMTGLGSLRGGSRPQRDA